MLRVETLTFEPLVRPVAELLHDLARLGAVLRDIGVIARQFVDISSGMPQMPSGGGSIAAADVALTLAEYVDKRLAVERQRHRAAHFGVVERRLARLIDQVAATLRRSISQIASGAWLLMSFNSGDRDLVGKVMSNLPAMKRQHRGRAVRG